MLVYVSVDRTSCIFCMLISLFSVLQVTEQCRGQSEGWLSIHWVLCGLAMSELLFLAHLVTSFFLVPGISSVRRECGRRSIRQRPGAE